MGEIKIKNEDSITHLWCGQVMASNDIYQPTLYERPIWAIDEIFLQDLSNGLASVLDGEETLTINTAISVLKNQFNSSLAVDKSGTDQNISGGEWIDITASRILWDINEDYDNENDDFVIPYDGIYFHDGEFKVCNLIGVSEIELAIFKRQEGGDDYWFRLDLKEVVTGHTTVQLSSATNLDMYEGEKYCLKIRLSGILPSATIDGDDDYTAWGYSFIRSIHG